MLLNAIIVFLLDFLPQRLLLRGTYHERLAALTMAHFGDNFVADKVLYL